MEYPNYKGRGNHNIHQLEALCEQFQEYIHQLQTNREVVIPKLGAYTFDGQYWSGESNSHGDLSLRSLKEALYFVKKWMEDPSEKAWCIIDGDNKVIYLSDLVHKETRIKSAKNNFGVDISDVRVGFPNI